MSKRKTSMAGGSRAKAAAKGRPAPTGDKTTEDQTTEDQISYSALSLHDLFEQQTRQMLDRADLDEEQKQNILIAMNCPCCGAGAMSYTVKLKR
jgi:outer membrane protein TolC